MSDTDPVMKFGMKRPVRFVRAALLVLLCASWLRAGEPETAGKDILRLFQRAHRGAPIRFVALGGSITAAGKGWIGPWLRETFPRSLVTVHNAGLPGTGSHLAMFRLERDVIACQPDLVLIEFAVNDGGGGAHAIRHLESVVQRLKRLPHPPAILFVETAKRFDYEHDTGDHSRVARHYGFFDVDLHAAVRRELAARADAWWRETDGRDVAYYESDAFRNNEHNAWPA